MPKIIGRELNYMSGGSNIYFHSGWLDAESAG